MLFWCILTLVSGHSFPTGKISNDLIKTKAPAYPNSGVKADLWKNKPQFWFIFFKGVNNKYETLQLQNYLNPFSNLSLKEHIFSLRSQINH